jgi:glycerol kinase
MSKLLALDQGTSSTRALIFDDRLHVLAVEQEELPQHYPRPGWVEHDPEDLWASTLSVVRRVLGRTGTRAADIAAFGITNQRETTIVWDRATGKPVHNAIVWQDRRTTDICARLHDEGAEAEIVAKTGLRLDPYFSATKIAWILDHVEGARARAARGELIFGTVDSFLLWRMTGGKVHATDATNASRTLLYDIAIGRFDSALCEALRVPPAMLPEIRDCAAQYGTTEPELFGGGMAIAGIAGDQHAALIGQRCFHPGMMKATYGTGAFILLNVGERPVASHHQLLTTVAYQLDGKRAYALEGAIFAAGAAVKWLRDGIAIIEAASQAEHLAAEADGKQCVVFVPALAGLGAPYWDPNARGAIFGITAATSRREIARAALESVGFQSRALIAAMHADWPASAASSLVLRVDGGMAGNDWLLHFLADILGIAVERPPVLETTVLGAAYLAGFAAGICPPPLQFGQEFAPCERFEPAMDETERSLAYARWQNAVARVVAPAKSRGGADQA